MLMFNLKGHGVTAICIQALFCMIALFFGMVYEEIVWGIPVLNDIFPALCVEGGLLVSLPFLYLLQKWLDKKGRTTDFVYNHRPFKWGVICCVFFAALIVVCVVAVQLFL